VKTVELIPIALALILVSSTVGSAQRRTGLSRFEDMVREANSTEAGQLSEVPFEQSAPLSPESTTDCVAGRTWTSSNVGAYFTQFCVSEHGNITSLISPAGFEHIRVGDIIEGYTLSISSSGSALLIHYDAGASESGWGPPKISHTSSGALVITRRTNNPSTGYVLELMQIFYMSPDDREGFIYMRVTNLSQVYVTSVSLSRYFDGDIDNNGVTDVYNRTADSVEGRQGNATGHGLMLDVVGAYQWSKAINNWEPAAYTYKTAVLKKPFNPTNLTVAPVATPTSPGDYVGRITFNLGQISGTASDPAGGRKAVMFRYHRF
jgi:hypothetical protein